MKIKAAVLRRPGGKLNIETLELARPREGELLVRIHSCGICHTDEMERQSPWRTPIVLGHEACGTVEEAVGCPDFMPGDKVALSYASCGECSECVAGRPYACRIYRQLMDGMRLGGYTPLSACGEPVIPFFCQGGFAEFSVVSRRSAVKIDPDMDMTLAGPFGCGIQTGAGTVLNCFAPLAGQGILITGVGTVGLSAVMAAKIAGCYPIIAADRFPARLELAESLGASHCASGPDLAAQIKSISSGLDFALDTSADDDLRRIALKALGLRGKGASLGFGSLPAFDDEDREAEKSWDGDIVEGRVVPQSFIPYLIGLWKDGRFPVEKLITAFPLGEINEAFRANSEGRAVKPVIVM